MTRAPLELSSSLRIVVLNCANLTRATFSDRSPKIERSYGSVGSPFSLKPSDLGSIPILRFALSFFAYRIRAAMLDEIRPTYYRVPIRWGKPWTILKASHWLGDFTCANQYVLLM